MPKDKNLGSRVMYAHNLNVHSAAFAVIPVQLWRVGVQRLGLGRCRDTALKGQVVEECFYLGIPQCDGKGIRTIGQARASFAIGMMASSTTCVGSYFLRGSLPAIQEMSPKGPK